MRRDTELILLGLLLLLLTLDPVEEKFKLRLDELARYNERLALILFIRSSIGFDPKKQRP